MKKLGQLRLNKPLPVNKNCLGLQKRSLNKPSRLNLNASGGSDNVESLPFLDRLISYKLRSTREPAILPLAIVVAVRKYHMCAGNVLIILGGDDKGEFEMQNVMFHESWRDWIDFAGY